MTIGPELNNQPVVASSPAASRASEARYRSLFEASPVAMWEEDHSLVRHHLDGLIARGITDIRDYLGAHPEEYARLVAAVAVFDANNAAVELFGARGLDDLLAHSDDLEHTVGAQYLAVLWSQLLAGARSGSYETSCVSLTGRQLALLETFTVAPGCEETWERIFIVDLDVTESKQMEASLRRTQQAIETASDDFYALNPEGRFIYANRAAADSLGRTQEELIGMAPWEIVPDLTRQQWQSNWGALCEKGTVRFEAIHRAADGHLFPVEVTSNHVILDDGEYEFAHVRDITERQAAAARLAQVNRLLRTVSDINQMIVRQTSVEALLTEACRIFVETGGFAAAWVGFCSARDARVIPVAAAGGSIAAAEALDIRYDESPQGRGPTGTAIRSGRAVICEDLESDPSVAPWRAATREHGYRSLASLPIRAGGAIIGALSVFADEPAAIPTEELALLEELADDLGHALQALEDAAVREQSENALRASEARYRRIIETAAEGIIMLDAERVVTFVNEEFRALVGCSVEELIGASIDTLLFADDVPVMHERWAKRHAGASERFELRLRCRDGSPRWVSVSAQPMFDHRGAFTGGLSMITDIHDRRLAEQRARRTLERLRLSVDAAVRTLARTIEIRDPYTAGHQERVTELALAIGRRLKLSKRTLTSLRIASLIHDLGKIACPAEILSKPGALSETEMQIIRQHPLVGYEILREMKFPGPVASVVRDHHERLDGSGYPRGLVGDQISPQARIIAVADVVEAMASHRPYRAALGVDAALEEIASGKANVYDREVVDTCIGLFRQEGFTFGQDRLALG